jgi:hypothetical protein
MSSENSPAPQPLYRLLDSFAAYAEGFAEVLSRASSQLSIFDPDASRLPLASRDGAAQLFRFLRSAPERRLNLVVVDPRPIQTASPRFVALCSQFGARIQVGIARGAALKAQDCFAVADARHTVRRPVAGQPRGALVLEDPATGALQEERYAQIWQESEPVWLSGTTGLS